ncbi:hypothetical protein G7Y89_g246 [Cudoniella acicularis]|uniref:Protein kinase domain-containing protein n=1 Tax=Cudoniella acicularis TaxID=354080 RepID=A0A8H4W838_9HELO|nr:hypothetical protein G7Y89_g246 [Cudoniella acicularis]
MTGDNTIEFTAYCPPGVSEVLATSFDYCVGRINHDTVLKYLHKKPSPGIEAQENLAVEAQIYSILGHHNRIQTAEGVACIHASAVLHCDINVNNLLLDKDLNIKLADFQERHLATDGSVLLNSRSSENAKSSMPRSDPNYTDQKTDILDTIIMATGNKAPAKTHTNLTTPLYFARKIT